MYDGVCQLTASFVFEHVQVALTHRLDVTIIVCRRTKIYSRSSLCPSVNADVAQKAEQRQEDE